MRSTLCSDSHKVLLLLENNDTKHIEPHICGGGKKSFSNFSCSIYLSCMTMQDVLGGSSQKRTEFVVEKYISYTHVEQFNALWAYGSTEAWCRSNGEREKTRNRRKNNKHKNPKWNGRKSMRAGKHAEEKTNETKEKTITKVHVIYETDANALQWSCCWIIIEDEWEKFFPHFMVHTRHEHEHVECWALFFLMKSPHLPKFARALCNALC